MKELSHQLINTASDKVINIAVKGKVLITETGKIDKLKKTEKEFLDVEDALKNFYKKEWEALKKDFVLINQNAEIGKPILHKFIGGGYTGSLSFQETPNGIYIYKNVGESDFLILINHFGQIKQEIELPEQLAWNIEYRTETKSLILDLDHYVYELELENNNFRNLGNQKSNIDSSISVTTHKTAFATSGKLSVIDSSNNELWNQNYEIEMVNGSTPFCLKLSNDGKLLAFHNRAGEIQIIDAVNGNMLNKIKGDFLMIFEMEFTQNNQLLVCREHYGTWGMRYFELSSSKEIKMDKLEIPEYTKEVNAFCFNADQSKLVLVQRTTAYVFDYNTKSFLHSFKIEHVVKTCHINFVGEKLGVRTDYGCFSLYHV